MEGATAKASGSSPGWALAVIAAGVLIAAVDTTIVVLARPDIQHGLHANLASIVCVIVSYLLVITVPTECHLSPLDGSLWLIPGYLVGGVVSLFGGRLADRWGAGIPATAGLLVQIAALLVYCQLSGTSPRWVLTIGSVINGVGSGAFYPSHNTAVMRASPPAEFGVSAGLLQPAPMSAWSSPLRRRSWRPPTASRVTWPLRSSWAALT
jgi:MFS family permease